MGELLNRSRELNEARRADEDRGVRVSLPRDPIDALINSSAVITTRAVHPRGTDALLLVTTDPRDVAPTLRQYVRAAEKWPVGARVTVSAALGRGQPDQVFLGVVTTRRRLTPTDSMRLVWIAGPSMPAGGAT